MGTDKRERQKAARASRLAAAEAARRAADRRRRLTRYALLAVAVVALVVAVTVISGGDGGDTTTADAPPTTLAPSTTTVAAGTPDESGFHYGDGDCPPPGGVAIPVLSFGGPPPLCIDPTRDHVAVFDTSEGEIRVDLHTDEVPGTVNNFVTLARWGYYDGTLLFRTDPSIDIVQGGAPHTNSPSDPGPGYTIDDEGDFEGDGVTTPLTGPYTYEPGQLVMARSAGPDSASAQFFFTTGPDASLLDAQGTYVVFGHTDEDGLAVLEAIMDLHVDDPTNPLGGGPSRDVEVRSVRIEEL